MVATVFGRQQFSCAACAEAAARGGDLKGENSGVAGSCTGPREWKFHGTHMWKGCPRASLDARVSAWIELHHRIGGKLGYGEWLRAPILLLEVFSMLDYAAALRDAEQARNATRDWKLQHDRE